MPTLEDRVATLEAVVEQLGGVPDTIAEAPTQIIDAQGGVTYDFAGKVHALPGSDVPAVVLTGQVDNSQIAGMGAAKLIGQLVNAQIADLAAAKITGQLADSQLAALAAAKVTGQLADTQLAAIAAAKLIGTLIEAQVGTGQISTRTLAAGAVIASKVNVATLSAIAADVGTLTAGIISGVLIRTAASGARIELDATSLRKYDAAGNIPVELTPANGLDFLAAGAGTPPEDRKIRWLRAGGTVGAVAWAYDLPGTVTAAMLSVCDFFGNEEAALKVYRDAANLRKVEASAGPSGFTETRVLVDNAGKSDFLQLVAAAKRRINFGVATVALAGTSGVTGTIAHGLGATPIVVLAIADGTSANDLTVGTSNFTSTTFTIGWRRASGSPTGFNVPFYWLAIG